VRAGKEIAMNTMSHHFSRRLGAYGLTAVLAVSGTGALRGCAPGCAPAPVAGPTAGAGAATTVSTEVLDLVNSRRAEVGLAPVQLDARLQAAATDQATRQAGNARMSHDGGGGLAARVEAQSYAWGWLAENVAGGQRSASDVMSAWMNSPGHRANILAAEAVHLGVEVAVAADGTWYWAMVLGAPA
jgi:uncharacterized protein YkwD